MNMLRKRTKKIGILFFLHRAGPPPHWNTSFARINPHPDSLVRVWYTVLWYQSAPILVYLSTM